MLRDIIVAVVVGVACFLLGAQLTISMIMKAIEA